jgi:DNA-directed RNA polymerase specialized sigma24 family protein
MEEEGSKLTDSELRAAILTGLAAISELEVRFRQPLERFLIGMCDKGDGRSQEKAVEIAGQILAECFTTSPSLLEKWQGGDNLEAFLRKSAGNRLRSWWVSPEKRKTEVNSASLSLAQATRSDSRTGLEEIALAERALRTGVMEATEKCPEGLVFMRLKGLHGVDQRAISRCWGHHEAQTSRKIRVAMEIIRTAAVQVAAQSGSELTMEDLQAALQHDPSILLGGGNPAAMNGNFHELRLLAEGGADSVTKQLAAKQMCAEPATLAFFAQTLNRRNELEAIVVRDPQLSGVSARLTECIVRSLEILNPAEAVGFVTPAMSGIFAGLLASIGADGGTLWMLCPGAAALEAVFNPLEPEMAGKRQPLVSGIVSLVLATGEPVCVSGVSTHRNHSPAIDIALGKTTHAMIAVPFMLSGTARGVLTAVRLTHGDPFGERETRLVGYQAEILAALIERNLSNQILG